MPRPKSDLRQIGLNLSRADLDSLDRIVAREPHAWPMASRASVIRRLITDELELWYELDSDPPHGEVDRS